MLGVTRCPCWVRVMFSICWLRAWSRACEVTFLEGFVLVVLMSFFFSFLLRICPRVSSFICVNFFCLLSASSSLQLFLFCLSSAFAASAPCETATKFYLWLSLFFFFCRNCSIVGGWWLNAWFHCLWKAVYSSVDNCCTSYFAIFHFSPSSFEVTKGCNWPCHSGSFVLCSLNVIYFVTLLN